MDAKLLYFNPRPREEGDFIPLDIVFMPFYFNPRPREEGDVYTISILCSGRVFQSTPS